jgi:hypothetical protein
MLATMAPIEFRDPQGDHVYSPCARLGSQQSSSHRVMGPKGHSGSDMTDFTGLQSCKEASMYWARVPPRDRAAHHYAQQR